MTGSFARGLAAGAAGTTALTAVTYLDQALRGRPPSRTPERVVDALAAAAGTAVPGRGAEREHRRTALGALSGTVTGLATGVAASVLRTAGVRFPAPVGAVAAGAAAMAAADVPAALLGVTDPRGWSRADWLADAAPHLAYGLAVQSVLEAVPTDRERATPRRPASAGLTLRSAMLGLATGSRSSLGLAGPALTAPTRRGLPGRTSTGRKLLAAAAVAGELYADKQPHVPERTTPSGLAPRLLGAAAGATRLAGRERANAALPVLAGVAGAAAGAAGGLGWRRWAAQRMPAARAAVVEDGVALLLAALACLPGRGRAPLVAVPG